MAQAAELRRHLLEELLPLWRERGVDLEHGGFHERLTLERRPAPVPFKRLVVQARQVYAFSWAAGAGAGWARATAEHGVEILRERYWDPRHGGFFATTSREGSPLDRRKDAYAHAFAMFALAHYHRATGDREALALAARTHELLERKLGDPRHGGLFDTGAEDWTPDRSLRRQNPHMHLLEALLALYEETGAPEYRASAERILCLLRERWLDASHGCLLEHFTADWSPAPGPRGGVVEPGHHFEWVWLLHHAERLLPGTGAGEEGALLHAFAERHGVDRETGGVFDEIDQRGRVVRDTQRVWPQTEYLKALAVRLEARPDPAARSELERALAGCLERRHDRELGGWHEQLSRSGERISDSLPASSVYHIVLALSELARVAEALEEEPSIRGVARGFSREI